MKTSVSRASQRTDSQPSQRSGPSRRKGEQLQQPQSQSLPQGESFERPQSTGARGDGERASGQSAEEIRAAVTHEEIARRAHELWEQDGRPEGRSEEHWLQAERQLRGTSLSDGAWGKEDDTDAREQARAIKASAERRTRAPARN